MSKYSVAVCHLNMVETVEESLRSIIENTTEEFEVLVVDDGSTDGSAEVLRRLSEEHDRVRVVDGHNENIAQARNFSVKESTGEYILHQLDADDKYGEGIVDFVRLYEALSTAIDRDVYLRGKNIHIASKHLLRRIPYRNVGYGEDLDLWRRMDAHPDVEMIWLRHNPVSHQIGYHRDLLGYAGVRYSTAKVNFQTGITPSSYLKWMISELLPNGWTTRPWYGALFHILVTPIAYVDSLATGHLDNSELPKEYRDFKWYINHILSQTVTADELIEQYEIDFRRSELSEAGRRMLFHESLPSPEATIP